MDDVQKWNQSRTIITLIIGMLAPIVAIFGYQIESTQTAALVNAIGLLWMGGSSVIAIIYRIKATKMVVASSDPRLPVAPPATAPPAPTIGTGTGGGKPNPRAGGQW